MTMMMMMVMIRMILMMLLFTFHVHHAEFSCTFAKAYTERPPHIAEAKDTGRGTEELIDL